MFQMVQVVSIEGVTIGLGTFSFHEKSWSGELWHVGFADCSKYVVDNR